MDPGCAANVNQTVLDTSVTRCRTHDLGVMRTRGEFRLVAVHAIAAGEKLFEIEGDLQPRPSRFSVQIGEDVHIDLGPDHATEEILDRYFWRFMNHSCDPNAFVRDRDVFAQRDIEPWESVTFNYNTTEWCMAEPFSCQCGETQCLGVIKGFKHLTTAQRERLRPFLATHLVPWLPKKAANRASSPKA